MTSAPFLNELVSLQAGEFHPCCGIDIQASIPTPLGECVRINYCFYGGLTGPLDLLAKALGLEKPFIIARGELIGIVKD